MLSISSLFSGVGALDLGLEASGLGRIVAQVEIDAYCRRVLERHWPEARRFEDVRNVSGKEIKADLLCGGFPCQGVSRLGKGRGLDDERSGLWSEFARLVGEAEPEWVVVENSSLLLKRGLSVVLGDFAALGYAAWWDCVHASAVGAPHQRDRLFVVARNPKLRRQARRGAAVVADANCELLVKQRHREHIAALARNKHERQGQEPADGGGARVRAPRRPGKSRLDGPAHGAPCGVDARELTATASTLLSSTASTLSVSSATPESSFLYNFPAPPLHDPRRGEAPRTAPTHPHWRDRHRAIGNAVVPAIGYVVGCAIRRIIESEQ